MGISQTIPRAELKIDLRPRDTRLKRREFLHGGTFDLLSRRTDISETDFKSGKMGSTQQKPLHVSAPLLPAHLRLTVHNGGANYPYLRTFMPTPYLATPDCFVLANN